MIDTVQAPFEPYAPLAVPSPPNFVYVSGNGFVTDRATNLVWQRQEVDDNDYKSWYEAWDYCADLNLGGKTDWRLPSAEELISIVYYGTFDPAINSSVFWYTKSLYYWSATTDAGNSTWAWSVGFFSGSGYYDIKSSGKYVRCVRGLPNRSSIFKDNGNGTVTDLATGRMWQREDDDNPRNWVDAEVYCQGLSLGGKQDWRLPNVKELQFLYDSRVKNPSIDADFFPNTDTSYYWSANTVVYNSEQAWAVGFNSQGFVSNIDKLGTWYIRCVRLEQ